MPIPLIGWAAAAVGAVVVGAVVKAFNDDDKSSTTTTSNRNELEEEKKKKELSHNEKIYASIKKYKKGVFDSIERDFGVKVQHKLNPLGMATAAMTAPFVGVAGVVAAGIGIAKVVSEQVSDKLNTQEKSSIYHKIAKVVSEQVSDKSALCAMVSNDNDEIVFHGIDTSHIEKENENLQNEINELKEFLDEIKNG
ncbi:MULTISPECIES: hypothetical protein [unclassified Campylobacter]|uniref:hypothetical protein n=1 Tax=unclassified Campylobacter TaxID=2593542 RepID=UPI0022E9FBFC|nr:MULTISPECIES: hypothetical protein [unclassified Campylobacter]MDA3056191.1 hypothetical protein [Campylobacter sp. CN_NA1]MDA3065336.1 hypothetical protein [Campylobacter sp. CN_NE4]MDA3068162.1 hypothetical protein [Campylobacter sp. CN_NE3]MDA3079619.1 hypothetical protein [Campylobacter sp. CS_NA2]MDA3080949.1 hypothetical protein [Campylobacter sp. CS_NA1]